MVLGKALAPQDGLLRMSWEYPGGILGYPRGDSGGSPGGAPRKSPGVTLGVILEVSWGYPGGFPQGRILGVSWGCPPYDPPASAFSGSTFFELSILISPGPYRRTFRPRERGLWMALKQPLDSLGLALGRSWKGSGAAGRPPEDDLGISRGYPGVFKGGSWVSPGGSPGIFWG